MSSYLEFVTLITTTMGGIGRENAIKRFIKYHARFLPNIFVMSDVPQQLDDRDNQRVTVFSCDVETPVQTKLLTLLDNVTTPLVIWVADDDFVTEAMVSASCRVLLDSETTVACDGLSVFLGEDSGRRENHLYTYRQYRGLKQSDAGGRLDHIAGRLVAHADFFNPMMIHGVIRPKVLRVAIESTQGYPIRWGDNIALGQILARGKICMLPTISNIRSAGTRLVTHLPHLHEQAEVEKPSLVLDRGIRQELHTLVRHGGELTPATMAAIDYYLGRSSGALQVFEAEEGKLLALLRKSFLQIGARWELARIAMQDRSVRRDLALARALMRRLPIRLP